MMVPQNEGGVRNENSGVDLPPVLPLLMSAHIPNGVNWGREEMRWQRNTRYRLLEIMASIFFSVCRNPFVQAVAKFMFELLIGRTKKVLTFEPSQKNPEISVFAKSPRTSKPSGEAYHRLRALFGENPACPVPASRDAKWKTS